MALISHFLDIMKTEIFSDKRFIAYAVGLAIDRLGSAMYFTVLPLLSYQLTGSFFNMALVTICQLLPRIFPGIYAGAVVDIFNKYAVFKISLITQALLSLILVILFGLGDLNSFILCIIAFVISSAFQFSRTTEMALVPILFKENRVTATTYLASIHTAMFIMGPMLGALALVFLNYKYLILANSLTYLAPIIANKWTRIDAIYISTDSIKSMGFISKLKSTNEMLFDSILVVKNTDILMRLMLFSLLINVSTGGLQVFIIYYLKNTVNMTDEAVSLILGVSAIGMFISTLIVPLLERFSRLLVLFIAVGVLVVGLMSLQLQHFVFIALGQFLVAAAIFCCLVQQDLIVQENVTQEMLGRINGLMRVIVGISLPMSTIIINCLSDITSFFFVCMCMVIGSILSPIVFIARRPPGWS